MGIYADERRRLAGNRAGVLDKLDRRLAVIDVDLERATRMLISGILDEDKGAAQIRELKSEQAALLVEREATAETVPDLTVHPAVADSYLASLDNLEAALRGPEGPQEAEEFTAVRDLVDSIIVTPDGTRSTPVVEVVGDLARLLAPPGSSSGGKVVAEEATELLCQAISACRIRPTIPWLSLSVSHQGLSFLLTWYHHS